MIASSQLEMAMSSQFGCVAVHTHRRSSSSSCFRNNLDNLFIPSDDSHQIDLTDLWVHHPQWQTTTNAKRDDSSYQRTSIDDRKVKQGRAQEIVFRSDSHKQSSNSGGVYSLVQKWRGFEAEAKSTSKDNVYDDDSIGDWESDRTGPSSCRGRDSDFTENDRLRVADIIKKLTEYRSNEVGSESQRTSWDHQSELRCPSPVVGSPRIRGTPRVRTSWEHQSDQRYHSPVLPSQRIRGRQAHIDLLKQMQRDRCKELQALVGRKAVSEFAHRARIQALLRLKFLRRYVEDKQGLLSYKAKNSVPNLRERANPSSPNGSMHYRCCHKEPTDKAPTIPNLQEQSSKEYDIQDNSLEASQNIQQNVNVLDSYETTEFPLFVGQETNWESKNHILANPAQKIATSLNSEMESVETSISHNKEDDAANPKVKEINYNLSDYADSQSYHEEENTNNQHIIESNSEAYWDSDVLHREGAWVELQSNYQETSELRKTDWVNEVSRPRSDWEDLRQMRYREMLDPFLNNEEIRVLLGRKNVSTFLSSGMRDKIDQMMISRIQGQQTMKNNQTQEEKHGQLAKHGQNKEDGKGGQNKEDGGGCTKYFEEFEEAENSLKQQYNESDEYINHMTSSPIALWPQNQGHQSNIYSNHPSPSNFHTQDNGPNSRYGAHPAIEMELIYDLRRHMEQVHGEISELRKSMKCCTDMQIKLQRCIKKEVAIALTYPDTKTGRRNPTKKSRKGGRCSVCSKVKVDCVLYRCGHMCTCFQCGHELQWSSGKCPLCRAPILDVIRTYSN